MDYKTLEALRVILEATNELVTYGEMKVLGEWDKQAQDMGLNEQGQELEQALAIVLEYVDGNNN